MRIAIAVWLLSCWCSSPALWGQSEPLPTQVRHILTELSHAEDERAQLLPPESRLHELLAEAQTLTIRLDIPFAFLQNTLDESIHEEIIEHFASGLADFSFETIALEAPNAQGDFQLLSDFLEKTTWEPQAFADNQDPFPYHRGDYRLKGNELPNAAQPAGQLAGKTVWLSAGHGWKYEPRYQCFKTQRHNHHGLVEDFATVESVNYHLLQYLYRAGAKVWTVRERDMNEAEVIVDNDQGSPAYRESGKWSTSRTKGYRGKTYRYALSDKKTTAAAHFTPDIPQAGKYWVSVHYVNGTNRSVDTRYKIVHAGGESMVTINQEVHGNTWVYLGQFYFEKGREGKVVLLNESSERGQAIIADAVRFGGGMGTVADCDAGRKSGEPRFEEAARYYARYQGFPHCVNDVMVRPHYAEWELAKGTQQEKQNAIYLSWHTNGSTNHSSGSESYIHSRRPVRGSRQLRDYIHRELIGDIRRGWDHHWKDRGAKAADFGELRGLKTMPGVLLEIAFHDHRQDARALSAPAFRDLVARSVYKGVVRYFAAKARQQPVFLPEPPSHLTAVNAGSQSIQLTWKAPPSGGIYGHAPRDYRIYYSLHPKAFAESVTTSGTVFTFNDLQPATTYYFQVVARNAGGESFPSAVVAVRTPDRRGQQERYLIVDGFDRMDAGLAWKVKEPKPTYAPLGVTHRLFLDKMNTYNYAGEHAQALAASGVFFDGASNEAVAEGWVQLSHYDGVDWYLGRESVGDQALDKKEIGLLKKYLDAGGNLLISGSELAYALDYKKQAPDFYRNYLKATFQGDDASNDRFAGAKDFAKIKGKMPGVVSPDYIQARGGAIPVLHYQNGHTAAVAYRGDYGLVNFAFPLEAIEDLGVRQALVQQALSFFAQSPKKSTPEIQLVQLPEAFDQQLVIDLGQAPEGSVLFELHQLGGKRVLRESWKHHGPAQKILSTVHLPPALYHYRFTRMGLEQTGLILKE